MEKLKKEDYIHGGSQKDFYGENEREFCNCPFCDADNYVKLDEDKGLAVVRCNECKLIYTNPRAKDAQENYFGDADVFYEEARLIFKGKKPHHRDRNYEYEIKRIKRFKRSGSLLDIGTNMGFFLRKAREAGFTTQGVEPSPALSEIARREFKLNVQTAFLENASLEKNHFDVITLIDVFEHVTNPADLLKISHELLKEDGIIVIKVPNGDYNHFKMKLGKWTGKGKNMDIWDCCEHVVHYTPRTFKKMVGKYGFKVRTKFIPLPIHSPIWANLVGHYYQYPSPVILDWKRILLRNLFYWVGRIELKLRGKSVFGPDLMFIVQRK